MTQPPLPPSPGTGEHVSIDLVNSLVRLPGDRVVDMLETPEATTTWLIERDLVAERSELRSYCQGRLTGLRADIRAAFASSVAGERADPSVLDGINEALTAAPHVALLHTGPDGGFVRSAEHPLTQLVEHAMSVVAEDAAALLAGNDARLLARCEAEPCVRFYLRTHARRQWCSTRCGDRVRAARAYARKRETAAAGQAS